MLRSTRRRLPTSYLKSFSRETGGVKLGGSQLSVNPFDFSLSYALQGRKASYMSTSISDR